MFTGIVEEVGEIAGVDATDDGRRLQIVTDLADLTAGQSLSVSGVCLTVEEAGDGWVSVFLSAETVDRTYLDELGKGDQVNLERALPAEGRLDGHIVQGHVDGTGTISDLESIGDDWRLSVSIPTTLQPYLVPKGSVALDGISLTVAGLNEGTLEVAIIPETYNRTTLSEREPGDPVHIEVDVVAKYVERLVEGY